MYELGENITLNGLVECTRKGIFSLPTVQRGFVWKPHQIENFWDSLLRGYPVGSFVLAAPKDTSNEFEILDGQQRASSICLGYQNIFAPNTDKTGNDFFNTSNKEIVIFIDLAKPDYRNDNRKYLFRVITRSHPWGYQRRENQKTLEAIHVRQALNAYNIEGYYYLEENLNYFWPYDSSNPVPFGLFVNGSDIESVKKNIEAWRDEKPRSLMKKNEMEYDIEEIYTAVQEMLKHQKIPLMYLDLAKVSEDKSGNDRTTSSADSELFDNNYQSTKPNDEKIEDRDVDEIENLFIRLNSGGTPLSGEELNYSVLKANITHEMQGQIEKKCIGLFKPPRFITIAFRLFSISGKSTNASESLRMRIKPKQFQRTMIANQNGFINFLSVHFLKGNLIEKVRELLFFHKDKNPIGLPPFICASLSEKAPEILFMLLYRLHVKKDKIDENIRPRVLGMLTLFYWLGRGKNQKDHQRLLRIVWPCVMHFETERFWSSETIERAMIDDEYELLTPFPNKKDLKKIVPTDGNNIKRLTFSHIYNQASFYGDFINKIFFNRELILYSQREQLSEWFSELDGYYLDDTNRPFDWDHICPHSYIYNQRRIHQSLRDWYNSNGNFRAWPYPWNRGDGNLVPVTK